MSAPRPHRARFRPAVTAAAAAFGLVSSLAGASRMPPATTGGSHAGPALDTVRVEVLGVESLVELKVELPVGEGQDPIVHTLAPAPGKRLIAVLLEVSREGSFGRDDLVLVDPEGTSYPHSAVAAGVGEDWAWVASGGPLDLDAHDLHFTFSWWRVGSNVGADVSLEFSAAEAPSRVSWSGGKGRFRLVFETGNALRDLVVRFPGAEPVPLFDEDRELEVFAIVDDAFVDRWLPSTEATDIEILEIDEDTGGVLARGNLEIRNGRRLMWAYGARHTWIGKLAFEGHTLESDEEDPLRFQVDRRRGYVYLGGRGTVSLPDGRTVRLPMRWE